MSVQYLLTFDKESGTLRRKGVNAYGRVLYRILKELGLSRKEAALRMGIARSALYAVGHPTQSLLYSIDTHRAIRSFLKLNQVSNDDLEELEIAYYASWGKLQLNEIDEESALLVSRLVHLFKRYEGRRDGMSLHYELSELIRLYR